MRQNHANPDTIKGRWKKFKEIFFKKELTGAGS